MVVYSLVAARPDDLQRCLIFGGGGASKQLQGAGIVDTRSG